MIRIFSFIVAISFVASAFGQGEKNSLKGTPPGERMVFGGGMGLGFGSDQDFVSLSPVIGYRLTQLLMAGTGVTFRWTNLKVNSESIKLQDYGINPFVRFTVYKNLFLQSEYEYLNYEYPLSLTETKRQNFSSVLVGGGFIQPLGENVGVYLMVLYNLSYKTPKQGEYTPYDSPLVIRAGVNVGNFGF